MFLSTQPCKGGGYWSKVFREGLWKAQTGLEWSPAVILLTLVSFAFDFLLCRPSQSLTLRRHCINVGEREEGGKVPEKGHLSPRLTLALTGNSSDQGRGQRETPPSRPRPGPSCGLSPAILLLPHSLISGFSGTACPSLSLLLGPISCSPLFLVIISPSQIFIFLSSFHPYVSSLMFSLHGTEVTSQTVLCSLTTAQCASPAPPPTLVGLPFHIGNCSHLPRAIQT